MPAVERLRPGLWRVHTRAGGNTVVLLTVDGAVAVGAGDDGAGADALRAALERITGGRIDGRGQRLAAMVLPAAPRSAAAIASFADAGVPVVVQRHALARLRDDARIAAQPRAAFVAYDRDYLLNAGEASIEVEHVGRGRTGADSVAYFRDLRAIAVGGLYTAGDPQPDCASGGSYAGWSAAIDHLSWYDFDIAVPAHGAPVGRAELAALKARLDAAARLAGVDGCRTAG